MKPQIKDRWMTAGTVLAICSLGVSLPGCSVNPTSRLKTGDGTLSTKTTFTTTFTTFTTTSGIPISISPYQCTTDFDCEMHARKGTKHSEWTWKKAALVVGGILVAGYFLEREFSDNRGANYRSLDVLTPRVNCDVAGRPGGGCEQ